MKLLLAALLVLVLVAAGAQAQEACDPSNSGASLIDLLEPIGRLACKVPRSVNLVEVMGRLTGTLGGLNAAQLQQLPGLIGLVGSVQPSALRPFLSMSAAELESLVPLLTEVPTPTLKVAMPLLAGQDIAVLRRMLRFLNKVSTAKLQQLAPMFGRLTQGQVNVLVHALNVVPEHAWDLLIAMVQGLGPVTDATVAIKQQFGHFGGVSSNSSSSSSNVTKSLSLPSVSVTQGATATIHKSKGFSFKLGGRKLMQDAAASGACDATSKGLEVGVSLLGPFGTVVCRYGPDTLRPVMKATIEGLIKQTPETLARLPEFTDILASADPAVVAVFFKIPQATLMELVPVFGSVDATKLGAQLKVLASADAASVSKMVFFLKATPASKLELLIGMFSKLSDAQVDLMARVMNALSPGQITLTLHLLDNFGFAVDAIGQHIPASKPSPPGFSIGPVHVVVG